MGDLIAEYDEAYAKVVAAKQELRALQTAEKEDAQRVDMLKFQLQENRRSQYLCGWGRTIKRRKRDTSHFQKSNGTSNSSCCSWREEYSSVDAIGEATREVESLESISTSFKTLSTQMSGLTINCRMLQVRFVMKLKMLSLTKNALPLSKNVLMFTIN